MDVGPSQLRFALLYEERRIPLFEGETILGRALTCQIRFNAPMVSREHVRLSVRNGRLIAENLSQTTGTKVNGRRLVGEWSLGDGDELVMGPCTLRIEKLEEPDFSVAMPAPLLDDDHPEELTMPGYASSFDELVAFAPHAIEFHTCPTCRAQVGFGETRCDRCGYAWPASNAGAVTQRSTLQNVTVHLAPTPSVVPVVYASEELTLDVNVDELRRDGVFLPSLILDPAGTVCELTLLPDGDHPMTLAARVDSVRASANASGPAGMEVRFTDVPPVVTLWLERWLAARTATTK